MKCAIAESYTHIGQAQIDKGEVRDRASEEHNRRAKITLVHQLEREN